MVALLYPCMVSFVARHDLERRTGLVGWQALDCAISPHYGESDAERLERQRLARLWAAVERRANCV